MAKITTYKSNFTSGVLDPRLNARADITHYQNGMQVGDDVVVIPHGGVRRRGGLKHLDEIPTAVAGNMQLAAFSYNSTDDQYLLVFADSRIYFFKNDAMVTNINGSGNPYLASPWPVTVSREIKWAQTADTMILVHEDYAPRLLVRGAADNLWTLSSISFDYVPQIDYNDGSSPAVTAEVQDITFTTFSIGNTFKLDLEGVVTESITYDTNTSATAQRIGAALAKLYNTGTGEVSCAYTSGTTYRVTFSGGAARNYELMTGYATTGTGTIAVVQITGGVPRTEDAWSATRGYPRSVCFFENRMVFGGTKSKPQTVFMSGSNNFYNFNLGEGLDDDAIQRTLDTDQVNAIVNVLPGRHLQVFTEGAEFFVPDFPITPENSNFRLQTTYGSSNARPIQVEGATLFLDLYGRGLYQFLYNDVEAAYSATSLSRLAAHLLDSPVDMALQRATGDDDTNYLYVVNADSTVAVLNTLRNEEIAAWTRWQTDGDFLSCAVLGESAYFLVQRADGTHTVRWYIEKHDTSYYTDSAYKTTGAPATTWSVSSHLNGLDCSLRGNDAPMLNRTPSAGSVTVEATISSLEIGLGFTTQVKLMPVAAQLATGPTQMRRTRLGRCRCLVRQTQGLKVNGYPMPERYLDVDALDTAPAALTGQFEVRLAGWGTQQAIDITQELPLPMTLLGVEYDMEIQ